MNCPTIMAILLKHRTEGAVRVQEILTKYGCHIKVRLGLHEGAVNACSEEGLILLQLCGTQDELHAMLNELNSVQQVRAKMMNISFDE
jgi:hypothetical protein